MSKRSTGPTPWSVRRRRRRALAVGLVLLGSAVGTGAARSGAATAATADLSSALPGGWELCILLGVGGHATGANLSDLDTWQAAEGGATDNGVAYNPFNTRRGTDQAGAALPASYTANGFPVFANWAAGCAATVATILQPDMAPIAAALGAGTLSPPTAFLSTVDQTPWCAPSDGAPCYSDLIAAGAAVSPGRARRLLDDASASLAAYDRDVATQTELEAELASDRQQLETAEVEVDLSRLTLEHATDVLRSLAIYDYTSNPSLEHMASLLGRFHPPNETDLLSQFYLGLDASTEVGRFERAQTLLAQAESARVAAAATVARTSADLGTATASTARVLSSLDAHLRSFRDAGACTAAPATSTSAPAVPAAVAVLRTCLTALGT